MWARLFWLTNVDLCTSLPRSTGNSTVCVPWHQPWSLKMADTAHQSCGEMVSQQLNGSWSSDESWCDASLLMSSVPCSGSVCAHHTLDTSGPHPAPHSIHSSIHFLLGSLQFPSLLWEAWIPHLQFPHLLLQPHSTWELVWDCWPEPMWEGGLSSGVQGLSTFLLSSASQFIYPIRKVGSFPSTLSADIPHTCPVVMLVTSASHPGTVNIQINIF
jgi:hypothetical protein